MTKLARDTKVLKRKRPRTGPIELDRALLVYIMGAKAGRRVRVQPGAILGREEECDVVLDDEGASRRHAQLSFEPKKGFVIEDLDSSNGTFVNGLQVKASPLTFGDKIAIGSHTVFLFTRHDSMDDQVTQAQKLQMLGELAGGIVHDFNNVLAAFSVGVDLIRQLSQGDERIAECLAHLEQAAGRGKELTGQLLGFARGGSVEREAINLSQIAVDAARLLQRMVPATVDLQTDITPRVGMYGSRSQMLQVVINLALNSTDAMPRGGRIVVRVGRTADEAILEVIDDGEGMDQKTLDHALDPFFTTKPRGHGTGLGLATVDRVVREHNGTVSLTSAPGQGTAVSMRLPFEIPGHVEPEQSVPEVSMPSGAVVLLVEDDPVVRALVVRMLELTGAEVLVAEDGVQGVELFREHAHRASVVLLDLDLPRLPGDDAFDVMRQIDAEVPIIIASGHLDDERVQRLKSNGAAGFMSKPFERKAMISMLARCMRRPEPAEQEARAGIGAGGDLAASPQVELSTVPLVPFSAAMDELDPKILRDLVAMERSSPGLLIEVARVYLREAPVHIETIAGASDDASRVTAAHTLKGSSLTLGASAVGKIAAMIETAARAQEPTAHMLGALRAAFASIRSQVEALADGSYRG